MGALLGVEVKLSDQECRLVSKEDYFMDEASGKQILAHMDVVGDIQANSYLFVGLKDAIFIGGTLIMLPSGELEKVVIDEAFGDDTEDAYGEIANIVSGVYSTVFEEQYIKKIRFVKTGLEKILPLKVDTDSDMPMPNQFYYMSSSTLNIGGKAMGKMQMLFPAAMLQLDGLLQQEAESIVRSVEKVVQVAPDFTGWLHGCANLNGTGLRPLRKNGRQHGQLKLAGGIQFLFQALQGRSHFVPQPLLFKARTRAGA